MIKVIVEKGNMNCNIEGRGTEILSELTVLVDSILGKVVDEDEECKKAVVEMFCKILNEIN